MNKIMLMGRLCADPEFRQTQSGTATCKFRIAVNRPFANKQTGEREADFISCTAWKNTAEFVSRYFRKGNMIAVEGSLRNNDWTDQNNVKHYSMDVLVERVHFCGSAENAQNGAGQPNANYSTNYPRNAQNAVTSQQNGSQAVLGDLGDFEDILSDGDTPF